MPVTIIMRGKHRRSGPEAVIDDLRQMQRGHDEAKERRDARLAKTPEQFDEKLAVLRDERRRQRQLREEAAHRLDEHDW